MSIFEVGAVVHCRGEGGVSEVVIQLECNSVLEQKLQ
jgi:hypothetical protein